MEWAERMRRVEIFTEDLNELVMNFLVIEGYKDAAEKFQKEAGTNPGMNLAAISDRMSIRKSIEEGEITAGIEKVNDLNPEILDTNAELMFRLKQQQFIELIRNGDIETAIEFAQDELAPRGLDCPVFLEELEKTMALLAFDVRSKSPVSYLLEKSQRERTAGELNAAILTSQLLDKDPKLPQLLTMLRRVYTELQARGGDTPPNPASLLHTKPFESC